MTSSDEKLEISKERLRNALTRLEDVVQKKIKLVESRAKAQIANAQKGGDVSVIRQEVDKMKNEINHLIEEKSELQNQVGKEKEANRNLKLINQEASKRVEDLISELKEIIK